MCEQFVKFKFIEQIVSWLQRIINAWSALRFGGSKPSARHKRGKWSVRLSTGCNDPGRCPEPQIYENWQIKMICQ
jgi:hypothetical protein